MNKAELVEAILDETDKYSREELEDSSEFTNPERKEVLKGLRQKDDDDYNPSAQDIAEENGYPQVNGLWVTEVLGRRQHEPAVHCRRQDGSSLYVHSDKFE
jgi:hypothetical protein